MRETLVRLLAVWFLVGLFPVCLEAQERLRLEIATDKTQFALGEPIVLYVTLQNAAARPVEAMRFLQPDHGFVEYKVKEVGGEELPFLPWAHVDHPAPEQRLSPGEAVRTEAKIFFGGNGWTFSRPGRYEIRGVYMGNVPSNMVAITVLSPADEPTRKAADLFLESEEVGYFLLFEGGDHLTNGIHRLEQVARQFPNTPHATYANYALGTNLLDDFANFKENRLRKADPRRAVEFLEKAKARPVQFYDIMHTRLSLFEGYTKVGDTARAKAIRTDLDQVVSERFRRFRPLLTDILKSKGME